MEMMIAMARKRSGQLGSRYVAVNVAVPFTDITATTPSPR